MQFDTVSAYTKTTHIFFEKVAKEGTRSRPRMVRIGKEMAGGLSLKACCLCWTGRCAVPGDARWSPPGEAPLLLPLK